MKMPSDDVPELDPEVEQQLLKQIRYQESLNKIELYNADPTCQHHVEAQWSGVKCSKCPGWYCA